VSEFITLADLERLLRVTGRDVDKIMLPVVRATAKKVAATQRQNVPTKSKRTRNSIKATGPGGAEFNKSIAEAEIGPSWYVGRFIELGTVRMAPRVFVANSLDPHIGQHQTDVLNAVAAAILDT
jgi:hypothetical protein